MARFKKDSFCGAELCQVGQPRPKDQPRVGAAEHQSQRMRTDNQQSRQDSCAGVDGRE